MNTKKIAVLEKAVQMLENGFEYSWMNDTRCNCGVVIRACGVKSDFSGMGSYVQIVSGKRFIETEKCVVTGMPFGEVQKVLLENDFIKNEIHDLELLRNGKILKRAALKMDATVNYFTSKSNLILYLRAWIELLKEEDAIESSLYDEKGELKQLELKPQYKVVRVDNSIFKQVENLVMQ